MTKRLAAAWAALLGRPVMVNCRVVSTGIDLTGNHRAVIAGNTIRPVV